MPELKPLFSIDVFQTKKLFLDTFLLLSLSHVKRYYGQTKSVKLPELEGKGGGVIRAMPELKSFLVWMSSLRYCFFLTDGRWHLLDGMSDCYKMLI